jgi:hypothetical protein
LCGSIYQIVQRRGGREFPPIEISILDFYKISNITTFQKPRFPLFRLGVAKSIRAPVTAFTAISPVFSLQGFYTLDQ